MFGTGLRVLLGGGRRWFLPTFAVDDYHTPDQPLLDDMTSAALKVLNNKNPKGFVLMVEGAHIDKQSHAMDAERAVDETSEFDHAVAGARDFAENVDRKTVVIVLADHECSGFSSLGALNTTIAAAQALPPDGAVTDPATPVAEAASDRRQPAVGRHSGRARYGWLRARARGQRRRWRLAESVVKNAACSVWIVRRAA